MLAVGHVDCQRRGTKGARWTGLQGKWGVPAAIQGPGERQDAGNKKGAHSRGECAPGFDPTREDRPIGPPGFLSPGSEPGSDNPCRWADHGGSREIWEDGNSLGNGYF